MSSYLSSVHDIDYAALSVKVSPCPGGYLGLFHKGSSPGGSPEDLSIAEIQVSSMLGVETEYARVAGENSDKKRMLARLDSDSGFPPPLPTSLSSIAASSSSPTNPYSELVKTIAKISPKALHPTTKLALLIAYIKINKAGPHYPYVESLPSSFSTVSTSWRSEDFAVLAYASSNHRTQEFERAVTGRMIAIDAYCRISQGIAGMSLGGKAGEVRIMRGNIHKIWQQRIH
jgi:hypothetical protein